VIDKLERICSPLDDAGEWATRVDFVESGSALRVVDTRKPARCNAECATAARACERVAEALDLSDVSEALYAGRPAKEVAREACGEEGDGGDKACSPSAPPAVPRSRAAGPAHEPMSERDLSMAKMMRSLRASGMGGQLFDRQQMARSKKMMKQMGMGGGEGDDDDDEEEDEEEEEGGSGGAGGGGGSADEWETEGGGGGAAGAAASSLLAPVDELASKAKEALGGGLKWLKSKVAGGGAAGGADEL
jgi:hypothetical protein